MKIDREDLGYYFGWIVAFGLAGLLFACAIWQALNVSEYACKAGESDCFRQWVSALGGWAAVAAAIPTILFLSRQISDASRYQKQNMQVQLRRSRAMAQRALRSATNVVHVAEGFARKWDEELIGSFDAATSRSEYRICTRILFDMMGNPVFEFVEDEVAAITPLHLTRVREILKAEAYAGTNDPDIEEILNLVTPDDWKLMMKNQCEMVVNWAKRCERECDLFLVQSAELTGL